MGKRPTHRHDDPQNDDHKREIILESNKLNLPEGVDGRVGDLRE